MKASNPDTVHLSSRFRHPERWLLFGRARLYTDRLDVSGLSWNGWYRRTIPFEEIQKVRWWAGEGGQVNMMLYLKSGAIFPFWVSAGGLWKYKLEELGGTRLRVKEELPEVVSPASAA